MKYNSNHLNNNRWFVVLSILVIVVLLLYSMDFLFQNHISFLFCPFHFFTHLYCPGCGMSRMMFSLLHFHFYQAFRYNMLGFILLPFFLIYCMDDLIMWSRNLTSDRKIHPLFWNILLVVALLFGILRNIPAFDFLAPTLLK